MPIIRLIGHDFAFPVQDVMRLFFGECRPVDKNTFSSGIDSETVIISSLSGDVVTTWIEGNETNRCYTDTDAQLPPKREVKRQLYFLLSTILDQTFPWGSLTGIRPTVVAREVKSAKALSDIYYVREDKALLAMETADYEDKVLSAASLDLPCGYIGIPFCPSRCSYCSFISHDAADKLNLLEDYLIALEKEMDFFSSGNPLKLSCLYIGGGTPTVFDDAAFSKFMDMVFAHIDVSSIPEITVEAGRADTITEHKLRVLKNSGVHRICINPQTLSDKTLALLGRKHSVEDFYRAFDAAQKIGFETINTDLIAGLPGETEDDFVKSLEGIISLAPENVTVHTLSKKKTAEIAHEIQRLESKEEINRLDQMLSFAGAELKKNGYLPYYLYKQKDTLGGHENIGYSKPGHECIYNVAMMSDQRSILAFGAGSMSKRFSGNSCLTRCQNVRDITEYMRRAEEMAIRKRGFFGV
jgi:oxygen-independent coproporphyrinogen-3 oxidase